MTTDVAAIDAALEAFLGLIQDEPALRAEFAASVGEFFHGAPPAGDAGETLLAARRHLEWFVLERHSPELRGTAIERRFDAWRTRVGPGLEPGGHALRESITGIFEVGDVDPGGAWLRDVTGFGEFAIVATETTALLRPGDLAVGRLFPVDGASMYLSRGAGIFRALGVKDALEGDLARIRAEQSRQVLRVSQLELERMFWGRLRRAAGDPVGDARRLLVSAGLSHGQVDAVLEQLRAEPFDTTRVVVGVGDVLSEILDDLAFETEIDLDAARRLLSEAWYSLHERPGTPDVRSRPAADVAPVGRAADGRADVERALAEFDRGRAEGGDLETLFRELERQLDLDDEGEPGDDDEPEAPLAFQGAVPAMVEEFLWEQRAKSTASAGGAERAQRFSILEKLGRFGEPLGAFEDLDARALLRFTALWLHEHDELSSAREARELVEALEAFCTWAEDAQGVPLRTSFGETLTRLSAALPRMARANRFRVRLEPSGPGDLFELTHVDLPGAARATGADGEARRLTLDAQVLAHLAPGDRVRGEVDLHGQLVVYCCYPPQVAELVPSRGNNG